MRRLNGLDAAFVYLETATNHMHVASTAVFDPSTMPGGYSFGKVRALVEARLPRLGPFRWRLREVPFQLHRPVWIDDPDFDLDYHLRRAALPAPGGDGELAEFAADVFGRRLDRRRPLWEMHVVEGLQSGMFAVVTKTHHAAIDGVSGAELTANLLDLGVQPVAAADSGTWSPERVPTDIELIADAACDIGGRLGAVLRAACHTAEAGANLRRHRRQAGIDVPPALFQAPPTCFNVPITAQRRFAWADVSLDDVKRIKDRSRTTVNDVVLALCSGALRHYLLARGAMPDEPMVAMAPISVRTGDEAGTMGNKVSAMLVSLATDCGEPAARLERIAGNTRAAKQQHEVIGAGAVSNWAEFLTPMVAAKAARLLASVPVMNRLGPIFNLVVSNIPGPSFPLYSAGAKLVSLWPMGPIVDGVALNITVMSYLGRLNFGLVACRDTVPDLPELAESIEAALGELLTAVTAPRRSRPARKATAPSGLIT